MSELLERIIGIAETAGEMMLAATEKTVETKGTKENYVTSTDLDIQRFLKKELLSALPGSGFLGEEEITGTQNTECGPDGYVWVVDPIDGTANYVRGIPMSVVAIGLVKNGRSVLGVVRQPYTKESFYAELGKGAFLDGKRIRVSDRTKEHAMVCTAWSCYDKRKAPLCFGVSERLYSVCEDIRRIGTAAYELCLLAKGATDIYFEARLAPWDYAASSCIVNEAGGRIISETGELDCFRHCMVMAANTEDNLLFLRENVNETERNLRHCKFIYISGGKSEDMAKKLEDYVYTIPDFPKPGIMFRDITTIIQNPEGFKLAIDMLVEKLKDVEFDYVVGSESRGFIFGAPVAYALGKGFVLARKKGKLPRECISESYDLEYGQATLEMHVDSFPAGSKIVIIDDLVATGGTTAATIKMIEKLKGDIVKIGFCMELAGFDARNKALKGYDVFALVSYPGI